MSWTECKIQTVIDEYPAGDLDEVAEKLGCTVTALRNKASNLGVRRNKNAATLNRIVSALESEPWLTRTEVAYAIGLTAQGVSRSIYIAGETFGTVKAGVIKRQYERLQEMEASNASRV